MHKRFRITLATAAAAAVTGGLLALTGSPAASAAEELRPMADFNGDGVRDLATSASGAYVGGKADAGQIVVLYGAKNDGSQAGVSAARRTVLSQNSTGVPGTAEAGDFWGSDTTAADFNGDGFTDLAAGAPGEDVGTDKEGGTVQILWGSANGLAGGTTVTDPRPSGHDWFGRSMDAADYDGDGKDDLVVGASGATLDVFKGGIATSGTTGGHYTVRPPIYSGGTEQRGAFNLHSGDVNGDGRADLVVDGFETDSQAGYNANYYLPGSGSGLTTTGQVKLKPGVITDIGDLNSDGYGDIVTGQEWDHVATAPPSSTDGGHVNVTYGSAAGPNGGSDTYSQDTTGVPGSSEKGDAFGSELHLGDINGDGHLDLVVAASEENLAGVTDTGAVTVLYGAADGSGITGTGAQFFSQDTPGVPNGNEAYDYFGSDVHIADLNGDGKDDLTVGAYGENNGNGAVYALRSDGTKISDTGAVSVYTSSVGVSATGYPQFGGNFAG
ncbi:VCBS repeat-containing protein [Streptomyces sp. A7024]|uniref:VCBS repeat-containing protein n=1 Tax=Streptomyces coryli TaxID=1128680 RepID=A0A6G4TYV0_9ACTN|nr:FG-GAP and VCBS repeat-containing protein [Streptomyces coryli]NGN64626.1 VCBS repeat-containing protein [Streptomyces coryli]